MKSHAMSMSALCGIAAASLGFAALAAAPPEIGPQVRVDTVGGTAGANETTVSASDTNPLEIIAGWNDYRTSGPIRSGFSLSVDGGQNWTGFILRPPAQNQSSVEGDPMTAFDPRTGTLWAGAISFSGSGGLYVAKKDPGESEFEPSVMARNGFVDKCWMAAGIRPGEPNSTRLYIAYNEGIIWSDDMGQTWTAPTSLGSGIGFLPRVGPDGEVYVAYWDFDDGMLLRRSLNGGQSFTTHTIATRMDVWGTQQGSRFPGQFRVPPLVYLDVDENTGVLYACYFDTTNIVDGQRNVDLYFTRSENQGTTWTTPVVINGDNDPPGDQFFSWIEVDSAGRIHIVTFDSRHTVQNDGVTDGMFDAYYTLSEDGGDTWTEFRLTPNSWNSADDGILGGSQFLGDYLGLAVAGNKAYPVYIDTTNGQSELYTNVISFESAIGDLLDFQVVRGTLIEGGIPDLVNSDDSRMRIRSVPGFTALEPNVTELQVVGSLSGEFSTLDLTLEVNINQPDGTATISMRNWDTDDDDEVGTHNVDFGDEQHDFNIAADPYLADNGQFIVTTRHVVAAPLTAQGFLSRYDLVQIAGNE